MQESRVGRFGSTLLGFSRGVNVCVLGSSSLCWLSGRAQTTTRGGKRRDCNCSKAEIMKCRNLTQKTEYIKDKTLAEKNNYRILRKSGIGKTLATVDSTIFIFVQRRHRILCQFLWNKQCIFILANSVL